MPWRYGDDDVNTKPKTRTSPTRGSAGRVTPITGKQSPNPWRYGGKKETNPWRYSRPGTRAVKEAVLAAITGDEADPSLELEALVEAMATPVPPRRPIPTSEGRGSPTSEGRGSPTSKGRSGLMGNWAVGNPTPSNGGRHLKGKRRFSDGPAKPAANVSGYAPGMAKPGLREAAVLAAITGGELDPSLELAALMESFADFIKKKGGGGKKKGKGTPPWLKGKEEEEEEVSEVFADAANAFDRVCEAQGRGGQRYEGGWNSARRAAPTPRRAGRPEYTNSAQMGKWRKSHVGSTTGGPTTGSGTGAPTAPPAPQRDMSTPPTGTPARPRSVPVPVGGVAPPGRQRPITPNPDGGSGMDPLRGKKATNPEGGSGMDPLRRRRPGGRGTT